MIQLRPFQMRVAQRANKAVQQLSQQDALHIYAEDRNTPMHIGQLLIYDPSTAPGGKVRFKDILGFIESRLDGARIFRQKLARVPLDVDHPYWIEDGDFDLEYHVRHIALPEPGDWRQLCILCSRIYARPLDLKRPLWEFTVIEGLDNVRGVPEGSFALLHKLHHAAMDGHSGLQMSLALHDTDLDMKPRDFDRRWEPDRDPSAVELLARAHFNTLMNPVRGFELAQRLTPGADQISQLLKSLQDNQVSQSETPRLPFNDKVSPHRVFEARCFPLEEIKAIRRAFDGSTVNDVMLALVGGALRKYLQNHGELPDAPLKIGAPVSIRSEDENDSAGNQVSMMVVSSGTHIADAAERLEYITADTKKSKELAKALNARALMDISSAMPAGLIAAGTKLALKLGLSTMMAPQINTIVTNVPGPHQQMYFAGAKLVQTYGMGLLVDGVGLFHAVTGYNGELIVTFLADRESMPDPAFYAEQLDESFAELRAAADKRAAPVKPQNRKTRSRKTKKKTSTA